MLSKVKKNLDEYLEFDSDLIFFDTFVRVFGGAVRDTISNQPINDVDIIVGSRSIGKLEYILKTHGYSYMESLTPKDLSSVYTDLQVISEPHTWIKGSKIVQLIRPSMSRLSREVQYSKMFNDLVENVDISCCGVSYDSHNIYENCPGAILHCLTKRFKINYNAMMYSVKRCIHRKAKFEDRGWREIVEHPLIAKRDIRIDSILIDINFEYVPYGK